MPAAASRRRSAVAPARADEPRRTPSARATADDGRCHDERPEQRSRAPGRRRATRRWPAIGARGLNHSRSPTDERGIASGERSVIVHERCGRRTDAHPSMMGERTMRLRRCAALAGCGAGVDARRRAATTTTTARDDRRPDGGGADRRRRRRRRQHARRPAATASSASPGTTTRKSAGRSGTSRRSRRRSRPAAARTSRTTPSRRPRRRPATSRT